MYPIKLKVDGRIGEAIVMGPGNCSCSMECPYFSKIDSPSNGIMEMPGGDCRLDTFHVFPVHGTVRGLVRTARCQNAEVLARIDLGIL